MLSSNLRATVASTSSFKDSSKAYFEEISPKRVSTTHTSLVCLPRPIEIARASPPTSLTTFLSRCLWTSRSKQLPINKRIELISHAIIKMDGSTQLSPSLTKALFQRHEELCELQRKITFDIEAICARFLPEGLYPLKRTPFIHGYSASFYFEIFEAVTHWLKSDRCNESQQTMGRELHACLKKTIQLLNLALEDQKS